MAIVYWPPQTSSAAVTAPQTVTLADATTTTSPDEFGIIHTTSGTAAAGFGETSYVELESAGGTTRRVMTDVTSLVTATDAAESSSRVINTMIGGALGATAGFAEYVTRPAIFVGPIADGNMLRSIASGQMTINSGGTAAFLLQTSIVTSSIRHLFAGRAEEAHGAAIASASTLTLGADGNYFHITGTTTINYLTTTSWQNGSRIDLYFNSAACTVTNNAGSVPGSTFAFELAGAVNITTTAGMKVTLRMDSTQSKWVEISRSA